MLQRLGGELVDMRRATRGGLVAGAEVGEYQVGELYALGKPGELLRRAVLRPGADPVGDVLVVGGLVNQYVGAVAGIFQKLWRVIITTHNDAPGGSGYLRVVIAPQQPAVIHQHVFALLQIAPGWTSAYAVRRQFLLL